MQIKDCATPLPPETALLRISECAVICDVPIRCSQPALVPFRRAGSTELHRRGYNLGIRHISYFACGDWCHPVILENVIMRPPLPAACQ